MLAGAYYFDAEHNLISEFVNSSNDLPLERLQGYSEKESSDIYERFLDDLCEPGHIGGAFVDKGTIPSVR